MLDKILIPLPVGIGGDVTDCVIFPVPSSFLSRHIFTLVVFPVLSWHPPWLVSLLGFLPSCTLSVPLLDYLVFTSNATEVNLLSHFLWHAQSHHPYPTSPHPSLCLTPSQMPKRRPETQQVTLQRQLLGISHRQKPPCQRATLS